MRSAAPTRLPEGASPTLPFEAAEYDDRLSGLRDLMEMHGLDAVVLTSPQNLAYYAGLLHDNSDRPAGCVVTGTDCVTIVAEGDAGRALRRSAGAVVTHDAGTRDGFWRAVATLTGEGRAIGCEADHLTMLAAEQLNVMLRPRRGMDIAPATMAERMHKSPAEVALLREGARIADLGARTIREGLRLGGTEVELATAARAAMEHEIARTFPAAEYGGTEAWAQSGPNADGAGSLPTGRKVGRGDILAFTCRPRVSGYVATVGRTAFAGSGDVAGRRIRDAVAAAHAAGMALAMPGTPGAEIAARIDAVLAEHGLLDSRIPGHGHSIGLFGREAGLVLRADGDAVLEPGMVIAMGPTHLVPAGQPGAGGYRLTDMVAVTEAGCERLTADACDAVLDFAG